MEQAQPPENYIYENLSFNRFNRFCRKVGRQPGVAKGVAGMVYWRSALAVLQLQMHQREPELQSLQPLLLQGMGCDHWVFLVGNWMFLVST